MEIFVPAEPFHPGEYIDDELKARGWAQEDLAEITGISRRQIINLIQGKSGITPETALALADAFGEGHDALGWMNLQAAYELATAAQKGRDSKRKGLIYNKLPVRELVRRGWIPEGCDTADLERHVCKLLRINKIAESPDIAIAARKSTGYSADTGAQLAWYGRALYLAESSPASRFAEANIASGFDELLKLAAYPEDARRVPNILADMGIRLVFVQHLRHTKIDGAALWLDDATPAIAMSLRFDRIDYFWFTLLHELFHIKNNDRAAPIDADTTDPQSDEELPEFEIKANRDAANRLIPEDKLRSFIKRVKPLYYESKIVQFAQVHSVHPGIVVGQLAKHPESDFNYKQLRKYLVKVRSHVIGTAITDGWNNSPSI